MSQSLPSRPPPPLPAANRSAPIAANQIQLRAGGSTNAPASTSASPMSDSDAQIATDPRSTCRARGRCAPGARDRAGAPRGRGRRTRRLRRRTRGVTDVAMMNATPVATSVRTRTRSWVVSAGLSVHVNWVHAHQISQKSRTDRATPVHVEMRCGERRDLRDREDEHEVEEQLDERDRLVFGTVQLSARSRRVELVNTGGSASRSFCRARP